MTARLGLPIEAQGYVCAALAQLAVAAPLRVIMRIAVPTGAVPKAPLLQTSVTMRQALTEQQLIDYRARICAAAEDLFAQHGVDGVSMRQIAGALGCSQTALYRYYTDKDEILAAVRTSAFHRFAESLEAVQSGRDAREDARAIGRAYLQFAQQEPAAYSLMFDLGQPDPSRYPQLVAAIRRTQACAAPYVQTMIDQGIIHGDAEELGHFFWAAAHGLVSLHAKGFMGFAGSLTDLHASMMRYLLRGMATPPAGRGAA